MNEMISIFKSKLKSGTNVVELLDSDHRPVGAICLSEVNIDEVVLVELRDSYILRVSGISIFFKYYKFL